MKQTGKKTTQKPYKRPKIRFGDSWEDDVLITSENYGTDKDDWGDWSDPYGE